MLVIEEIRNNYQLIIFEKKDKQSFICAPDAQSYIRTLNNEKKLDELTLFGFSSGGVIASHILSGLKDLKCKKKIILNSKKNEGYLAEPKTWLKIKFLTQNAILMVACDKEYDFKDYIEKFSEFLKVVKKDNL